MEDVYPSDGMRAVNAKTVHDSLTFAEMDGQCLVITLGHYGNFARHGLPDRISAMYSLPVEAIR